MAIWLKTRRGLGQIDPVMALLIREEARRQSRTLSLVASESLALPAARWIQGSVLTQKLGEGYPGARYCTGCEVIDKIERLATERACRLFGAEYANVQPYSGTFANVAVFLALLKPGDRVLAMDPSAGGHHSHGQPPHLSSQFYRVSFYGVSQETGLLDYELIEKRAKVVKPRLIIAGASSYPRIIDFERFASIANGLGAYLLVDIAHTAGIIVAGLHPSPVPWADVVTSSTHKTLMGPRGGGFILARARYAALIDQAVWPGLQGAPVFDVMAARAVLFQQVATEQFRELQRKIVVNAHALAEGLFKRGIPIQTGGTDTHLVIANLGPLGISGLEAERRLAIVGLTCNKILLPGDAAIEAKGLRLGSVVATQRGFGPVEMGQVADLVARALTRNQREIHTLQRALRALTKQFPAP